MTDRRHIPMEFGCEEHDCTPEKFPDHYYPPLAGSATDTLRDYIRASLMEDRKRDADVVAARAAHEWYADRLFFYCDGDPLGTKHRDDCDWAVQSEGTCSCGLDEFLADLLWSRLLHSHQST